jgi:hypothetical protein
VDSILSTFHANPTRAKFAGKGRRLNPKTIDMEIPLASQRFARPTQLQISIQLPTNSNISRRRQEGRKPVQLNGLGTTTNVELRPIPTTIPVHTQPPRLPQPTQAGRRLKAGVVEPNRSATLKH